MLKKKLGGIKRGGLGFLQNHFSRAVDIPAGVSITEIGKSVDGRPLECFRIGNGPNKILYAAGIHGNEVGTVKLAYHLLDWLDKNKACWRDFTFFVIPCLNPDGYALARENPDYFNGGKVGRFNAHSVDLNRNFDTPSFQNKSVWGFGKNYAESVEVDCGTAGNSEPETRALTEFILNNNIRILFMFHNAGGDVMGNNNPLSQKLTHIYAQKTGFHYVSEEDWAKLQQSGTAKEWCDLQNIAYIEIEGSTRYGADWGRQRAAIEATIVASGGLTLK